MLKRLFGNSQEKFAMELPDSPEQESNAVFAPPIVEKKEEEAAPAAGENVNALTVEENGETPAPGAPAPVPAKPTYVDSREFIIAAIKESSAETKAKEEKASSSASFAENFSMTVGNKSDRRRPGLSMEPFMGLAKTMGSKI